MLALGDSTSVNNVRIHRKSIEKIKSEIENINFDLNLNTDENKNDDLLNLYNRLKSLIIFCVNESEDIEEIYNNFEELRKEKDGYKLQSKRLTEENKWLREELKSTQDKLQQKELDLVEVEENNKSLSFLLELQSNSSIDKNSKTDSLLNGGVRYTSLIPIPVSSPTPPIASVPQSGTSHLPSSAMSASTLTTSSFSTTNPAAATTTITSKPGSQHHQPHHQSLPNHDVPPRLKTLHQLVIQYATQGRYDIAIPLCKQTLYDLEQSSGHYDPDVATMLNILSLVYRDKGDFEGAAESLTDALEIRKKTLGLSSPKVAATLNNLSVLYAKQGNHAKAEPMCKDALKIREEILGTDHPDVAKQLNNLALHCHNQGKFDDVEKYYKRALAIYMKSFSVNDPNVIKTKNNLANSYIKQGKLKEAEKLLKDLLTEAVDKQWSGSERDSKSKPIWVIAEEREKTKKLSMSVDTLNTTAAAESAGAIAEEDCSGKPGNEAGNVPPAPFGFEMRSKSKEDKIVLLMSLKLLKTLYKQDNKQIAADTLDEWLTWAGKSLKNYQMDYRWLSYESSLIQSDLYDQPMPSNSSRLNKNSSHHRSSTLWYPTPTPYHTGNNSNFGRPNSTANLASTSSSSSLLNSSYTMMDNRGSSSITPKSKIPVNFGNSPSNNNAYNNAQKYLYASPHTNSTQPPIIKQPPSISRSMNLKKAISMTTLTKPKK